MPSSNSNYSSHDRRTDSHLNKIEKKVDKVQATLDRHRKEEKTNGEAIKAHRKETKKEFQTLREDIRQFKDALLLEIRRKR